MTRIRIFAIVAMNGTSPPHNVCASSDQDIRVIQHEELGAVVGAEPAEAIRALSREEAVRNLLAHQRVVENVMPGWVLLPVKFGTVLPDEASVLRLLSQGAPLLRQRLSQIAGHIQIELVASWKLEDVLRDIAADVTIARLKAKIEAGGVQATVAERAGLGQMVKAALDRRRDEYGQCIVQTFVDLAADFLDNPLLDDRFVANLALLLPQRMVSAYDQRLDQLDNELGGHLNFRSIGPLPPYSFATVEVAQPSFEAIARARQALGLGECATAAEIKSSYRRLLRQLHPDLPGALAVPDRRFADLRQDCELLMSYLRARGSAGDHGASVIADGAFDRDAVESTILVTVRRQDSRLRQESAPT